MAGLLMTRPREAAEQFVDTLPQHVIRDFPPVYSPLIEIETGSDPIPVAGSAGLVFSSANGVRAAVSDLPSRSLPAFCVGKATTIAAQNAGWQAKYMGQNADELVQNITLRVPKAPLLHVRGRHTRGNISARLVAAGIPCAEYVAYDQVLLLLSEEAQKLLSGKGPVIAPIFSPRTARQFAELGSNGMNLYLVALSDAVAEPLKSLNFRGLLVSESPDATAMRQAVIEMSKLAL